MQRRRDGLKVGSRK